MGHLRPYRGKKSQATRTGIVLKRGEIFLEVPESGVGTGAGKLKVGDGTTAYGDLPYFMGENAGAVKSVNNVLPDESGNLTLTTVPYAENLVSPDNVEEIDTFIFRTTAGSSDIGSGTANLNKLGGNCEMEGNIIKIATPTSFKSYGLNQFDKDSMVLEGYTINSNGAVIAQEGSYVCYAHAVGGLDTGYLAYSPAGYISKVGWSQNPPTTSSTGIIVEVDGVYVTGITNNANSSILKAEYSGYLCIVVSNPDDLVVHPKWSGTYDTFTAPYSDSNILIPTTDASGNNLPTASYGFPSVNDVRDEINLAQKTYIQRIGHYVYTPENLNIVKALDVDYIYDSNHIFYVLTNPITYNLAATVSSEYEANDYGSEEFIGTEVGVYTNIVYGANLRDKLRRDVVTISKQDLSVNQQNQVRDNIDAAQNHLVFEEAPDEPNQRLLNTIISGNPMNTIMGANKRLLRRYNDQINSKVASVNGIAPDSNGNVTVTRVPMADNLYSDDNVENHHAYLCRTTAGTTDIDSGTAQLSYLRGSMTVVGRVEEQLNGVYNTEYVPDPEETYITPSLNSINAATWRASSLGGNSGTYTFTYDGTNWTYNSSSVDLATYGLEVYGTVKENDEIVVTYVKENRGTLQTLKPLTFIATGLNVCSGVLANTGITSNKIASKSGSYLYYAKAPYSDDEGYIAYDPNNKITNIGFVATNATPAVGADVDSSQVSVGSSISTSHVPDTSLNDNTGWIVVECNGSTEDICIHPRWSGEEDTDTEAYATSTVTMPTKDANNNDLPYVSYGLPAVKAVADEINFDLKQYIQRIGHYPYSAANLATVQALGVDYDYDSSHIFYVLASPITITLDSTVSGAYTANDIGIEYYTYTNGIGTVVNGNTFTTYHLYGQNLRDKLRRDVLTISEQDLSSEQKAQVLANIGAASAASVTQLNNDYNAGKFGGPTRLTNADDMNYILTPGLYYTANGIDPVNHPNITNYQNATVIVYRARCDIIIQFWISYNDANSFIYMRKIYFSSTSTGPIINNVTNWFEFKHYEALFKSNNQSHYTNLSDYYLNGAMLPNRSTGGYIKLGFPLTWNTSVTGTIYCMIGFEALLKTSYLGGTDDTLPIPIKMLNCSYITNSNGDIKVQVPPKIALFSVFSEAKLNYLHMYYSIEDIPLQSTSQTAKYLCYYILVNNYCNFVLKDIIINDNYIAANLIKDLVITKIESLPEGINYTEIAYYYNDMNQKSIT